MQSSQKLNSDLTLLSAVKLSEHIRKNEVTCLEVVDAFIAEQKIWNPRINAIVENRWDSARKEAIEKDEWRKTNPKAKLPPFFGVPFTVKEMIQVEGFKSTLGSIHRKRQISKRDASVVERFKKAGGILLATSNVPEMGFWFECDNPIYGSTKNPFDLTRTSGGSSGGEAAIIGAGASPIGFGSDVGGSIRVPAGFCGIFGHKPSNRIVPTTGHYPTDFENITRMEDPHYPLTVIGPMVKRSEDLRPTLELIVGSDGLDPEVRKEFKLGPEVKDWSQSTVWILPRPAMAAVTYTEDSMAETVELSARYFESLGAKIRRLKPDFLKNALFMWSAGINQVAGRTFEEALFNDKKQNIGLEMMRTLFGVPNYTLPALGTLIAERLVVNGEHGLGKRNENFLRELAQMQETLAALLTGDNILILPIQPRDVPKLRGTYTHPFDFAMAAIFNVLGLPVTTAPITWNDDIPQSVQIVSAWGQDAVTISAAQVLEAGFGGWRPPVKNN